MSRFFRLYILILAGILSLFGAIILYLDAYRPASRLEVPSGNKKIVYRDSDGNDDSTQEEQSLADPEAENSLSGQTDAPKATAEQEDDRSKEDDKPEEKVTVPSRPDDRSEAERDELVMTFDEVSSMTEIGAIDKIVVLSILGRLDEAKLNRLVTLANDGITRSEYEQMKSLLESSIPPEDVNRLVEILEKNRSLYFQGKLKP